MKFLKENWFKILSIVGLIAIIVLLFAKKSNNHLDPIALEAYLNQRDSVLTYYMNDLDEKIYKLNAKKFTINGLKTLSKTNSEVKRLKDDLKLMDKKLKHLNSSISLLINQVGQGPLVQTTITKDSIYVFTVDDPTLRKEKVTSEFDYKDKYLKAKVYPENKFMTYDYNPGKMDISLTTSGLFKKKHNAGVKFQNPNTTILDSNVIITDKSRLTSVISAGVGYGITYIDGSIKAVPTASVQIGIPVIKFWSKKK